MEDKVKSLLLQIQDGQVHDVSEYILLSSVLHS